LDWGGLVWRRFNEVYTSFDLGTISGNPLNMPVNSVDDHWTLMVLPDAEENLHIMGNTHATDWLYVIWPRADLNWPPTTTGWTVPAFNTLPWNATGLKLHTYAYGLIMQNGTTVLFADQEDSAVPTDAGRDFTAWFKPAGAGITGWLPMNGIGEWAVTTGPQALNNGIPDRVYVNGITTTMLSSGVERLHVTGIWAKRDPADSFLKRNTFYLYTDLVSNGNTVWKAVDGTTLTMPMDWTNYTPAFVTSSPTWSENSGASLAIDSSGYPHMLVQNRDISSPSSLEVYWNGSAWTSRAVSVQAAGATVGPSIFNLNGRLKIVTTAFDRLRIVDQATNNVTYLGGLCGNGARPVPDPTGMLAGNRMSFVIPNGDVPLIFDYGANTIPKAPG